VYDVNFRVLESAVHLGHLGTYVNGAKSKSNESDLLLLVHCVLAGPRLTLTSPAPSRTPQGLRRSNGIL